MPRENPASQGARFPSREDAHQRAVGTSDWIRVEIQDSKASQGSKASQAIKASAPT
jgi:hypothetical protein